MRSAIQDAIEVDDPINWSEAIRLYAQYLVERTELIQEVDEGILDFAHKTFYEYFLAVYFSKVYENKELVELLREWIGDSNYDELARLIIEIVIQNDDPRQHKYLINYMLETLKKVDLVQPNSQDIFDILADLYNHNMLQPKFHTKYFECILYHPEYVVRSRRIYKSGMRTSYFSTDDQIPYDSQILAGMFTKTVNEEGFASILDALYLLNNEFRQHITESFQEDYWIYITRLFSACFEMTRIQNREGRARDKKYELELNYFLSSAGISYTLQYPEIFICVVNLILTMGRYESFTELLNYRFEANSKFFRYTSPSILYRLFLVSCNSPEHILITLILIIHCAKERTNMSFWHIFRWIDQQSDEEKYTDAINNVKYLWDVLNDSEGFEQFQKTLSEHGLYDVRYDDLYQKLYWDYVGREKELHQRYVKKFQMFFQKFI